MHQILVLTVVGRDRTGLVESIAHAVASHGGNWLESRMCRLGGEFAGLLRIDIDPARLPDLNRSLESLEKDGLSIVVHLAGQEPRPDPAPNFQLHIVGHDRPGIVRQISHVLAAHGANVEEFTSALESAPMSGELLFKATARLRLPQGQPPSQVQQAIEQIAGDLMIDAALEPLPTPAPTP